MAEDPILGGDTLLGPPAGTNFHHRNHVNSSSVITDHLGNELARYVYLPFGEVARNNSCGTDVATAKFTGKELDEETNLYYYGARYYDPAIGRFLSADTVLPSLTDGQALNRYSYVRNNPVVYVDPTGHMFEFIGQAIQAAENAVSYVANAVSRAADWAGDKLHQAGDFIDKSAGYTWAMMKAFGSDPRSLAVFVIAIGICIATMNAPAIVIIMQTVGSTLAAMAAQSMAVAAGVTNGTVLSIIGIAAGVLGGGGGLSQLLKGGAAFAVSYGLGRAEAAIWGDGVAERLAPLNALAGLVIVNGLAKAFASTPAKDAPKDPGQTALSEEEIAYRQAGSGGGDPASHVSRPLTTGQRADLIASGVFNLVGGATGFIAAATALVAATGWIPIVGWGLVAATCMVMAWYGLMQINQAVKNDGWLVGLP